MPSGAYRASKSLPGQTGLQDVLHEPHRVDRDTVIDALQESYAPAVRRAAQQLAGCANAARFYIDPDEGKVRPWIRRCKHRLCPFCGRARSAHVAEQLTQIMYKMKRPRMLVLTVRSRREPLRVQLHDLRGWLSRLRRSKDWRTRVRGGAYTVEVTLNERTGLWHPHLHVVYEGEYFPFKLLQGLWHEITGGSEVVWVQAVHEVAGAARELAKYIGKIQQLDRLDGQQIREYAEAVRGGRMVQAFGESYGFAVVDEDGLPEKPAAEYTVSLPRLVFLAGQGAGVPQRLLLLIAERWPVFASYIWHLAPMLEPEESRHRRQARLLANIEGRAPPQQKPPGEKNDVEKLEANMFLAFTAYRLEDEGHVYDDVDMRAGVQG